MIEVISETDAGICEICGKKMVKHIVKDGARYHVHAYWSHRGVSCSTKDCVDNHGKGKCDV